MRSRREAEAAARRREQDEEARRGSARRVDDAEDTFSAAVSRLDAVKRELAADQRAAERDGRRRGWQAADAKQALDGWIAARKRGAEEEAGPSGPSSELTHRAPLAPDRLGKLAHHSVLSSLAAARARAEALGETARRTEASLDEARDVLRREDAAARCVQRGSAAAAAVEGFDAAVEVLDQERERVLSQGAERAQAAHAATEAEAMLQRLQQGLESNAGGDASSLALSEVPGIRRAMARAHTAVQGVVDAACAIESASDARGAGGEASAGDAQPQWRAETSGVEAAWQVFEEASALACDRVNVAVSQIEQEVGHREMRASLRRTVLVQAALPPAFVPFLRLPLLLWLRQDAEDSRQAVARRLGVARGRLSGLEAAVRVRRCHRLCPLALGASLTHAVDRIARRRPRRRGTRWRTRRGWQRPSPRGERRLQQRTGRARTWPRPSPKRRPAPGRGTGGSRRPWSQSSPGTAWSSASRRRTRRPALRPSRRRGCAKRSTPWRRKRCAGQIARCRRVDCSPCLPAAGLGALAEDGAEGPHGGVCREADQGAGAVVCAGVRGAAQPAVTAIDQPRVAFQRCACTAAACVDAHREGAASS